MSSNRHARSSRQGRGCHPIQPSLRHRLGRVLDEHHSGFIADFAHRCRRSRVTPGMADQNSSVATLELGRRPSGSRTGSASEPTSARATTAPTDGLRRGLWTRDGRQDDTVARLDPATTKAAGGRPSRSRVLPHGRPRGVRRGRARVLGCGDPGEDPSRTGEHRCDFRVFEAIGDERNSGGHARSESSSAATTRSCSSSVISG